MKKRKLAVQWSAEEFVKLPRCYFWTFTTIREESLETMAAMWDLFLKRLRRRYHGLQFLRVVEPHASGTRWHLHVLFDQYMRVEEVRALANPLGWGRLQVARVRDEAGGNQVAGYLSKYVAKGRSERGARLYSCSLRTHGWEKTRVSDIETTRNGKTHSERFGWAAEKIQGRGRRSAERMLSERADSPRGKMLVFTRDWLLLQVRLAEQAGDEMALWLWKSLLEKPDGVAHLWVPGAPAGLPHELEADDGH